MYTIEQIIKHSRERDYMSGVERDRARIKSTGEVFTPTHIVQQMINDLPEGSFADPSKTFIDPTCGDGQFLSEILIKKMENGSTYEQAISTIYGVDLMHDNCVECIKRLYFVEDKDIIELKGKDIPNKWNSPGVSTVFSIDGKIVNIVNADGLVYDFSFGNKKPNIDDFF